jgi:LPXTG-motif cell wall-anchored protein
MKYAIILVLFLILAQIALADVSLSMQTTTNPSSLYPGSNGVLNLQITSSGTVGASSVKARIISVDAPLQIEQMQSESFGSLGVGDSFTIPVKVHIPQEAQKGFYNIIFEITACQSSCLIAQYTSNVEVKDASTNFEADFESNSGNSISFTIANVGLNGALAVSATILPQDNYRILGSGTNFLGNLAAGDFTIASFDLASNRNQTRFDALLEIKYTDLNNNRQIVEKNVSVNLVNTNSSFPISGRAASNPTSNLLILGVIVVVVIAGYFWFKRRKK